MVANRRYRPTADFPNFLNYTVSDIADPKRKIGSRNEVVRLRGVDLVVRIFSLILLALLLVSCDQENTSSRPEDDKSEKSLALANAWLDAFSSHDLGKMQSILSQDIIVRGLGGEDSMSYAEVLEKLSPDDIDYSPFTDRKWLTIPPNDSLFDGEGVLFWGTSTLNFKNGVSSSFPIHIVTIVKEDQIISMRFYYNIQKIQKDLGYTVSLPNDE